MRRLILIFILALILIVSGCSANTGTSTSSDSSNQESAAVEETLDQDISDKAYLLNFWTTNMENSFEILEESGKFITEHDSLFPTSNIGDTESLVDTSITSKHINKSPKQYATSLFDCNGQVISIEEEELEGLGIVTFLHVVDDDIQSYEILYIGELPDILADDIVHVIGLPLGVGGFANVSGGHTNTIVLAGSYLEKIALE